MNAIALLPVHSKLIELARATNELPLDRFLEDLNSHLEAAGKNPASPLGQYFIPTMTATKKMAQAAQLLRDSYLEMQEEIEKLKVTRNGKPPPPVDDGNVCDHGKREGEECEGCDYDRLGDGETDGARL